MKKKILILIACLLLVTGCKDVKLKNGENAIVTFEEGGISSDDLYNKLKAQYGGEAITNLIDEYLLDNHIGEYQSLFSFHVFYTHYKNDAWTDKETAHAFRDFLQLDKKRYGRQFFIDLVKYYKEA